MIPLAIFSLLQVADAALTYKVISAGGVELNPVMRWLFDRIGVIPGLVIAKVLITALVVLFAPWQVVAGLCVLYAGVVSWNTYQLYRSNK